MKHYITTLLAFAMLICVGCASQDVKENGAMGKAGISQEPWGRLPDGTNIELYTLRNANGMTVKITTYGAAIVSIMTPDRSGKFDDVALGFDSLEGYLSKNNGSLGATVGRYANRIAKGRFTLDGEMYQLAINNDVNHLHGGDVGFDDVRWTAEIAKTAVSSSEPSLKLNHYSPHGDEEYPGNMRVSVTYTLTNDNAIRLDYEAAADRPTIINLTNHTYFNLAGKGKVLDHVLMINADRYTPFDETQIPTGKIDPVAGTPLDFRQPKPISSRFSELEKGYDHNYVLNRADANDKSMILAARVTDPSSGRTMEVRTTEPGLQLYTSYWLDAAGGHGGVKYVPGSGLCLETQHYPDSPNHPEFPSTVIRGGEVFKSTTVYRFSAK